MRHDHMRARNLMMRDPRAAFYRGAYLAMERVEDDPSIPTAATDGKKLFVNLAWMEQWTPEEQMGVLVHEVQHKLLKHHLRFDLLFARATALYPRLGKAQAHRVFNIAADARINRDLLDDGFRLPKGGVLDEKREYVGMSTEAIFFKLLKQEEQDGEGAAGGMPEWGMVQPMPSGGQPGQPAPPGQPGAAEQPTPAEIRQEEQAIASHIAVGMALARKAGKLPGAFAKALQVDARTTDWRDTFLDVFSAAAGQDDYSHTRMSNPGRRAGLVLPGVVGVRLERVAIAIDTSGSINEREASFAIGEVNAMVRSVPISEVTLLQCDAKVQDVRHLGEGETVTEFVVKGRGGTDFRPVFQHLDQDEPPEVLVYITDLEGRFPSHPPTFPVIWLTLGRIVAPFGDTLRMSL